MAYPLSRTGCAAPAEKMDAPWGKTHGCGPSFRGDAKHRSRNLEIPRCAIAHLRSGLSDHPGMTCGESAALRHHQHVEHDDRRQRQDHRPDADGPQNVLGAETLFSRNGVLVFEMHDAPPRFWCCGDIDARPVLKT